MVTLDGVMQSPGASKEDASEGFKYGGWQIGWDGFSAAGGALTPVLAHVEATCRSTL